MCVYICMQYVRSVFPKNWHLPGLKYIHFRLHRYVYTLFTLPQPCLQLVPLRRPIWAVQYNSVYTGHRSPRIAHSRKPICNAAPLTLVSMTDLFQPLRCSCDELVAWKVAVYSARRSLATSVGRWYRDTSTTRWRQFYWTSCDSYLIIIGYAQWSLVPERCMAI